MLLIILLYALLGITAAQQTSTQTCRTSFGCGGRTSLSTTDVVRSTVTNLVRVCPTSTVTIFGETSTTTVTQTATSSTVAALQVTDTSTISRTNTVTDIEEAMTTAVVTTTMTLTLTLRPVSSIPVTSGFVPIASQSDYVARKRSASYSLDSQGDYNIPRAKRCIPLRPDVVSCDQTIFTTTTRTVANRGACPTPLPVTTVTRQPRVATIDTTVASTVWSTSTETATVNATVFDTVTELTTSTFTWTSRVISNAFTTTTAATTTVLAACAPNNIIKTANGGHGIFQLNYGGSRNQIQVGIPASNPYQCCVACHETRNCIWSNFQIGCELVIAQSCNPQGNFGSSFNTSASVNVRRGSTISNGPCGRIANAGDVPVD
ncbi:Ff.00g109400.m01.CDS01 [Fusarium sp. VM40]|nr:Ff.00g109400.m01.CDS01 [Fusarium sp. VM40]